MTTLQFAALAAAFALSSAAFSTQAQSVGMATGAEPATQAAPAQAAKNSHDPDQVVCKHMEVIGSRLGGHQECHTRATWDQIARDAARETTNAQNRHVDVNGH